MQPGGSRQCHGAIANVRQADRVVHARPTGYIYLGPSAFAAPSVKLPESQTLFLDLSLNPLQINANASLPEIKIKIPELFR
jgi:hypothetical protein